MIQDFETQLQVVQRALGEVVLPALGSAEGHVIEQLQLSIAALAFMQQRLPHSRRYHRASLQRYLDLAAAICALLGDRSGPDISDLAAVASEGRKLLDNPSAEDADYCRCTRGLRELIAALVADGTSPADQTSLDALVLDMSGQILSQDRVWCLPLGFELRPDDLPPPDWHPSS